MTAWLLDGLVAVPLVFAVLTRVLGRRGDLALGVAVTGGVVTFAWSVWAFPSAADTPVPSCPARPASAAWEQAME